MNKHWLEAIVWLFLFVFIGGMLWRVLNDSEIRARRSVDRFESDVQEAKNSMLRAGVGGLERLYNREKQAAIDYQKDEEQGQTRTGGNADDADRAAESKNGPNEENKEIYD